MVYTNFDFQRDSTHIADWVIYWVQHTPCLIQQTDPSER